MSIESNTRTSLSSGAAHSYIVCIEPDMRKARGSAQRPTWTVDSHWVDAMTPIATRFTRLERFTLGAGVLSYALVGTTTAAEAREVDFVILMNPTNLIVAAAVSGWMLDGLPYGGGRTQDVVKVALSDIQDYADLTHPVRQFSTAPFSEVVYQLSKRGRVKDILAEELGVRPDVIYTVVGF